MEQEQQKEGLGPKAGRAADNLPASDTEPFLAAPARAGKLLEPLSRGADSDEWSLISEQLSPSCTVGGADSDEDYISDIVQLDGCDSLSHISSSISDDESSPYKSGLSDEFDDSFVSRASILSEESISGCEQPIPVVTGISSHQWDIPAPAWHEWQQRRPTTLPTVRTTVRRDNRLLVGAQLPSFSAPNCRSLAPKLRSFAEDLHMREIGVALCSESWEKASNKKYQMEVERLLEMKGLKMVSNPRKYRRGGGVCIVADLSKVSIQPLDTPNPHNLEIVFALVKPMDPTVIKEIITFALYSPPRSRKKAKMTDLIVTTLHSLLTSFPQAGIMGGGDRNCYNVSPILQAVPGLKNLQQLPTLKGKNLDIFLSNMGQYYSTPVIVPPFGCDVPNKGVPSDHSVPIMYPVTNATINQKKEYTFKTTRPLPESGVRDFGKLIVEEAWEAVKEDDNPEDQEEALQNILNDFMERSVPTKTVRMGPQDRPFMTKEVKIIDRRRKREYRKNGRSQVYLDLSVSFSRKFKLAGKRFLQKNVDSLMEAQPGQAYRVLKRIGAQPGDNSEDGLFELPEYVLLALTDWNSQLLTSPRSFLL